MASRLALHCCSPSPLASPSPRLQRPLKAAPPIYHPTSDTSLACSVRRPRAFLLPSSRTRRAGMAVATGNVEEVLPPSLDSTADPPPFLDGTTRLYISYIFPYAQRTWIARNYKGLQEKIKLVPIDLQCRPSWYKEKVYPPNKVLKLQGCRLLSALPSNMSALTNLRHLDASCELVSNIQGLAKLTALQEIQISERKARELEDMSMLKELQMKNFEEVKSKEEAEQARLDVKEHLDVLKLSWDCGRDDHLVNHTVDEEVLDSLRTVDSIRQMSVTGYGGVKCPSWMEDHSLVSSSFLETV